MKKFIALGIAILLFFAGCLSQQGMESKSQNNESKGIYELNEQQMALIKEIIGKERALKEEKIKNIRVLGALREGDYVRVNVELDGFPAYYYFSPDFSFILINNTSIKVKDYLSSLEKAISLKEQKLMERLKGKPIDYEIEEGFNYGNGSIKVVIFASPVCRFTAGFFDKSLNDIKEYADKGKITLSMHAFLLNPNNERETQKAKEFLCIAKNDVLGAVKYTFLNEFSAFDIQQCMKTGEGAMMLSNEISLYEQYGIIASPTIFIKLK